MFRASNDRRFRSWGFVDAADPTHSQEIDALERKLSAFYDGQAAAAGYWQGVEEGNAIWDAERHPYHWHLSTQIPADATVVDFGCGSAHAARNLKAGITYIGLEGSQTQVDLNRKVMPAHRFVHGSMLQDHALAGTADWAVSFFAIEHCPRPDALLKRMVETCKPGGRIAILCPDFSVGMNSLRSGRSALTKREKLRRLKVADLMLSYIEEKWLWPTRIREIQSSPMKFPIYLRPRCFDAPFFSDSDAVYLTSESKMAAALQDLGCQIEVTAGSLRRTSNLEGGIAYIVAQTAC